MNSVCAARRTKGGRDSDNGLIFLSADFVTPNPARSAPASPASPPLALGTGPGFPVNVCVGWRRLGRGRSISALILAADARPKLSLVGYGPEAELAGQRVVRLGEKSDLPIFVLLASAPS